MSFSTGGGPETRSTLSKIQKELNRILGPLLTQGLRTGAAPMEGELFSADELAAIDASRTGFERAQEGFEGLGFFEALQEQLSGIASTEISDAASTEFFEKSIAAPLAKEFTERVVPTLNRAFRGFTTRRGIAIGEAASDFADTLASQFAKIKFADELARRELLESAKVRQAAALQFGPAVLEAPGRSAAGFGAIATSAQARVAGEEARLRPENNPFFGLGLSFLGIPQTRVVDEPERLTGFGEFLAGTQALQSTFGGPVARGIQSGQGGGSNTQILAAAFGGA